MQLNHQAVVIASDRLRNVIGSQIAYYIDLHFDPWIESMRYSQSQGQVDSSSNTEDLLALIFHLPPNLDHSCCYSSSIERS
jgi:hypothetical protein